ncbi:MAG: creatininase family protein [Lysobacterales bacterium]
MNKRTDWLLAAALLLLTVNAPAQVNEADYYWDIAVPGEATVFMEHMTSGQIAAAMRRGATTAIVPSGGLEQNGPYLATGKHNFIVTRMAEAVARKLGDALVTATVKFVPEGDYDPPSGHQSSPGTVGVSVPTYTALIEDISRALKTTGFTEIILMGDSGLGQQEAMAGVAGQLSTEWRDTGVRVVYASDYYAKDLLSLEFIKRELGVEPGDPGNIHTSYYFEAVMAANDPATISAAYRAANGEFSIGGVELGPLEKLIENGRRLVDYRSDLTVAQVRATRKRPGSE